VRREIARERVVEARAAVGDLADELLAHAPDAHPAHAAAVPVSVREDLAGRREHPLGAVVGHVGRRHLGPQP
jgi:hypothetical protein